MYYTHLIAGIGLLLFLIGVLLLYLARRADRKNYIIQKATPLPLKLVNERDDVWLRGHAVCLHPLSAPHFGFDCLHYNYKLEEKVVEMRTDSKGKTTTTTRWVTRETSRKTTRFHLRQGDASIAIDGAQAEFKDLAGESDSDGRWRHSVDYLPYPCELSAVGSVSEDRERLEPYGQIPLLLATRTREEFVAAAERGESWLRFFGFLLVWLGAGLGLYGLFDNRDWPVDTHRSFNWQTLTAAAGPATGVYLIFWGVFVFNTFVVYRQRADNAWHNIDPDLRMRHNLIPNLVEAVKGFIGHERELLERVTSLRNQTVSSDAEGQIASEQALSGATRTLIGVIEASPDLKSQPLASKLMRELTALEEKIAHGRSFYNATVKEYNDNVMSFPRGLLARAFGFKARTYFSTGGEAREAPEAQL